ncbi:MAG: hypothetical protein ACFFAA_14520 [Promethearchaeota archaeon]
MSKAVSYYDWELSFKRKTNSNKKSLNNNDSFNALGISDKIFKDFIKKWKKVNIS